MMAIDGKENTLTLLAAAIVAIFLFCGEPQVEDASVLSSLEKWDELVVGAEQGMIGDNNHRDNGNGN